MVITKTHVYLKSPYPVRNPEVGFFSERVPELVCHRGTGATGAQDCGGMPFLRQFFSQDYFFIFSHFFSFMMVWGFRFGVWNWFFLAGGVFCCSGLGLVVRVFLGLLGLGPFI